MVISSTKHAIVWVFSMLLVELEQVESIKIGLVWKPEEWLEHLKIARERDPWLFWDFPWSNVHTQWFKDLELYWTNVVAAQKETLLELQPDPPSYQYLQEFNRFEKEQNNKLILGPGAPRHYEGWKFVGSGSSGTVWRVKEGRHFFAIKTTKGSDYESAKEEWEMIQALKLMPHKNIVRYKESQFLSDPRGKSFHIVMEYCKKGDLTKNLKATPNDKLKVMTAIAEGVKHLHGVNIVHGDLKPENIFLTEDDDVKIGDFGWADQLEHGMNHPSRHKERSGIVGTSLHMSPQLAKALHEGNSSTKTDWYSADVWALGVLFYWIWTGRYPFNAGAGFYEKIANIEETHVEGLIHNKSEFGDDHPTIGMKDLIKNMLQPEVEKRLKIKEVLVCLEEGPCSREERERMLAEEEKRKAQKKKLAKKRKEEQERKELEEQRKVLEKAELDRKEEARKLAEEAKEKEIAAKAEAEEKKKAREAEQRKAKEEYEKLTVRGLRFTNFAKFEIDLSGSI